MNRILLHRITTLILFLSISFFTKVSHAQVSTVGKEFWVGFMENNRVLPNQNQNGALDLGIVVITASEASTGTISYLGSTVNFNLQVGQQFVHRIENFDAIHRTSGFIENKSVYIISSGNVSVYAFNERERSADGTVVLPISALGKDHYITSHFETVTNGFNPNVFNTNNESLLLVVAVEDNTQIEITPSVNPIQNPTSDPIYITLNAGQSYQLKARGDLTGSRVRVVGEDASNCKNIAVFGGNKWTGVGNCGQANDHLFQQAYPVNTWGNEFLHVPLAGRNSGELVKILASEPNTEIIVNSVKLDDIGTGEFITLDFSHTQSAYITSNKPISVTGFAKSMDCNRAGTGSDIGDPFMVGYSPNQQLLREVTFVALQLPVIDFHYVNIVTKTASVQNTFLDGRNVGNQFTPFPSNSAFSFARIQINQGVHRLENSDGFIGYVYGFGDLESYGFAVGASLENLNFEVLPEYDFEIEGDLVACLDSDAVWVINPENDVFTYFTWDFGDGSEVLEGKEVVHKYQIPGTYNILVTASISPESCDQQEEIRLEVIVEEFLGEIKGPVSVCPDIEEIEYVFDIDKEYSKIEWIVEGGVIVDEIDNLVTIRWLGANNSAKLFALPFNKEGCPADMVELIIVVNNRLDPGEPSGFEQVCFDGNTLYEYSVAEVVNGRGYEWFVTEGEIVGSNDKAVVQVNWSSPGVTGKIWYREFSLINDDCEGISPELDVVVTNEFTAAVEESVDILCFGEQTGRISLNVFGGQAPYTYTWSHNQSLNAPQAENIPAGDYSVTITDDLGCEIVLDNIIILEPALLEVAAISMVPTSCFGRNDGEAILEIQGGVSPYTINLETSTFQGNQISLFDLEGRSYELEITDANGCILATTFTIDSPLPLDVDVRIEKFACPGESNGELIADPQSLNAPYSFIWGFDNSDQFILQGIPRGDYDVTVVDNRGCISFGSGEMLEADPIVRMPTGFNPKDGVFEAVANCEDLNYELVVYTRWGELIHKGTSGWDGKINEEDAPLGTYSYMFSYNYILNDEPKSKQIPGSFTLIR
ncbi:PKD domain-containing protein [Belliella sp. R4-6]|uniref:PKD domain-containing protein n=1 Tax=Belliella alkalica TaxID=1730871 RepID=A0ABS9VCV4_9BACT|nr:PKD domain-containing protein [Belliella alkalica]MCH7414266.1 PKD domain-containing protein [Belliella alkalica]